MKIIQVIHTFLPYSAGGSELNTYYLSKKLSKRHEIYLFYSVADPNREEYEVRAGIFDGLNIYEINNAWRYCNSFELTYKNDNIAKKFADFIDQIKPDIVHFHHLTCLSTTLIEEVKKRDIPVVFTLHDYWLACQRGQLLRRDFSICEKPQTLECVKCMAYQLSIKREEASRQIEDRLKHIREICSMVDIFVVPSDFAKTKSIELGIPGEKIICCGYGVDLSVVKNFKRTSSEKLRFGNLGTLIPSKGIHVLIEAFNNIKDGSTLKIYGKAFSYHGFDAYLSELQKAVSNPNIKFMGGYDNKRLPEIFSEIDILIAPAIWYETSSITIKEAFMTNTPVIASRIGGMAELVDDNKNGFLFQPGDSKDLYTKIKRFIDEPGMVDKFSRNIPPPRTIEENAQEIEGIYSMLGKVRV